MKFSPGFCGPGSKKRGTVLFFLPGIPSAKKAPDPSKKAEDPVYSIFVKGRPCPFLLYIGINTVQTILPDKIIRSTGRFLLQPGKESGIRFFQECLAFQMIVGFLMYDIIKTVFQSRAPSGL